MRPRSASRREPCVRSGGAEPGLVAALRLALEGLTPDSIRLAAPEEPGLGNGSSMQGMFLLGFGERQVVYRFPYPSRSGTVLVNGVPRAPGLVFEPGMSDERELDLERVGVSWAEYWRVKRKVSSRVDALRRALKTGEGIDDLLLELESSLNAWDWRDSRAFPLLDRTNALAEVSSVRQVRHWSDHHPEARRMVHPSHFGRLCPLETPESDEVGLTLFLARDASVRDERIRPKRAGGSPDGFLGCSASLVPFIQHSDGVRAMMGGKNMKQALPLLHPEVPLVLTGHEEFVAGHSGRVRRADRPGLVEEAVYHPVQGGRIRLSFKGGGGGELRLAPRRHVAGIFEGSCYWEEPRAATGRAFRAGEVLAEGCGVRDGCLALGANLLVAYMPWFGHTFEDGLVAAERLVEEDVLTTPHVYEFRLELKSGEEVEPSSLPLVGSRVGRGTLLARAVLREPGHGGEVRELYCDKPVDGRVTEVRAEDAGAGLRSIAVCVGEERRLEVGDKLTGRHGNKGVVSLILAQAETPYVLVDGRPFRIDLIISPMSVTGRMNLGQVVETHYGWVRKHRPQAVAPDVGRAFDPGKLVDWPRLKTLLLETGLDELGRAEVFVDAPGGRRAIGRYVVGYQYIMKLGHLARDKFQARGEGPSYDGLTRQPCEGPLGEAGQRFGEMEAWALLTHHAPYLLSELLSVKADDERGRARLKVSDRLAPALPHSLLHLRAWLRSAGLALRFRGPGGPLSDDDLLGRRFEGGQLEALEVRLADTGAIRGWSSGEVATKGGGTGRRSRASSPLSDPAIFGATTKEHRLRFGHLELPEPVLNPVFETCREVRSCLRRLMARVESERPDLAVEIRCAGFLHWLIAVLRDLPAAQAGRLPQRAEELLQHWDEAEVLRLLRDADEAGAPARHPRQLRWTAFRQALVRGHFALVENEGRLGFVGRQEIRNRLIPADQVVSGYAILLKLYPGEVGRFFLEALPVLPLAYRQTADGDLTDAGRLTRDLFYRVNSVRSAIRKVETVDVLCMRRAGLQESLAALIVEGGRLGRARVVPVAAQINGKEGLLRRGLLGKRVDCSGRAVIVPDPLLRIDEFGLPLEMARRLLPERLRRAVLIGGSSLESVQGFFDRRGWRCIVVRQPSLHKYNVLALRPRLRHDYCIGLPPMLCKGYGADFDGDTMSVFLPTSALAQVECGLLAPQECLFSAANGGLMLHLGQDIALGAHVLCETPEGQARLAAVLGASRPSGVRDAGSLQAAVAEYVDGQARPGAAQATRLDRLVGGLKARGPLVETLKGLQAVVFEAATQSGATVSALDAWALRQGLQGSAGPEAEMSLLRSSSASPLGLLARSGARGTPEQYAALVGDFAQGLSPACYFQRTPAVRANAVAKKLGVRTAGALTRLLAEACYEVTVSGADCGDRKGLALGPELNLGGRQALRGRSRAWRSPVTCLNRGTTVCQACCGKDPSSSGPFPEGYPIGLLAAQSIGEAGTQAALKALHGQARYDVEGFKKELEFASQAGPDRGRLVRGLLDRFSSIYRKDIASLHMEVVLRAMLRRRGETGEWELAGLTSRAAEAERRGFLCAASFRSGLRALADAAAEGASDRLSSPKARVILGRPL